MKILITGATGLIGQHLLQEIKDDGHSITAITRKKEPRFWCVNTGIKIIHGDISDKASFEAAFNRGLDMVINLAAELRNANNFESTNVTGVKNLIELAEKYGVKKVIHLSSVGVVGMQYSGKSIEVDEQAECFPKNEYERTKLESEKTLNKAVMEGKFKMVILRPTNVFGDHHPRLLILNLLKGIKAGKKIPLKNNSVVNYVYAGDVAHAIRYCINNETDNRIINIGNSVLLEDFLREAALLLKVECNLFYIPVFLFSILEKINYFGMKRLKAKFRAVSNFVTYKANFMADVIGYKYGIKAGLKKTIDFYIDQKLL